jgi:pilus assembly protein CpaC
MTVRRKLSTTAVLLVATGMAIAQATTPAQNPPQQTGEPPNVAPTQQMPGQGETPPQTATPPTTATPAPGQGEVSSAAPLRVMVGKTLLINTTERLKRVSVTDPGVADALVVTPTQIMIHGRAPGEVSLLIWDEMERSRSFDLRVDVDVSAVAEEEKRVFPDEQIEVTPSRNAVVLSGHVSTEDVSKRAGMIAEGYSSRVVNVLTSGPVGAQEVLLEVKFAEVDRSATIQLGANFFKTGGKASTVGTTTTSQFGGFNVSGGSSGGSGGGSSGGGSGGGPSIGVTDALNIFVFNPDINVGVVLRALQQKNLLQILAEPNLIAVNGKEASFLAGGEFPFPVVQPSQGVTAVTIQFREFGVRLKFIPYITPAGFIHLRVTPEVSTLDFANGLTISGFRIPALSTRRADTEFEIKDGQSFVIAGLMDNRTTRVMNKIPGIGNIPILGNLFRSKDQANSNAELMVMVTARRISPTMQPPPGPKYPEPFLDKDKFDGSKPSGAAK